MTAFSNTAIFAPVPTKPHIARRHGWWRVSPSNWNRAAWEEAHRFVEKLNRNSKS